MGFCVLQMDSEKGADADRDKFKLSLHMSTYIFKIEILKKKKSTAVELRGF